MRGTSTSRTERSPNRVLRARASREASGEKLQGGMLQQASPPPLDAQPPDPTSTRGPGRDVSVCGSTRTSCLSEIASGGDTGGAEAAIRAGAGKASERPKPTTATTASAT